ncbi:unnamed protein product [Dimorphilus gyrociliatus]|uniref:Uncharacterized protein n=1 Tax=Dimorphilus gyrociliatus TaxID=2664684 RepID=A0A7I8V6Y6_9ANNE|nr:unnamed protein product [Dimorphilus gyrociliatus]
MGKLLSVCFDSPGSNVQTGVKKRNMSQRSIRRDKKDQNAPPPPFSPPAWARPPSPTHDSTGSNKSGGSMLTRQFSMGSVKKKR